MHNGAYDQLKDAIVHHFDAAKALRMYDPEQLEPELRETYKGDASTIDRILETLDPLVANPRSLSKHDLQDIMAFLGTLTDPAALELSSNIPIKVPSGLPVDTLTDLKKNNDYKADAN